jgi:antitoxin component of MazEF toxin-antitoxin module
MELVKLGAQNQVTIPGSVLRSVGLTGDTPLLVETTPEGAILLRPAAVYPIETPMPAPAIMVAARHRCT